MQPRFAIVAFHSHDVQGPRRSAVLYAGRGDKLLNRQLAAQGEGRHSVVIIPMQRRLRDTGWQQKPPDSEEGFISYIYEPVQSTTSGQRLSVWKFHGT